jgi:hypothetical protein
MATIRFACAECGTKLKSDGEPGGSVECPKCGATVPIPGEVADAAPDVVEVADAPAETPTPRIKAPWEYAKEWARVRFALVLCTIAAGLTILELATGEVTDRLYRRAYTSTELYLGLFIGLLLGAFRIYSKSEFRHVPRQWVSRPLLWVCVGVEAALILTVTGTAIAVAATPPSPAEEGPALPAELTRNLSPRQQEEVRKQMREIQDLRSGTPVQRDSHARVVSVGFGLAVLLAGVLSIIWPVYLKELALSVKDKEAFDFGDRALDILGPAFLLWVLSVSIYQFLASATGYTGVYRPQGKSVTVIGLITIQVLLLRMYWRLRKSLRAKARFKKPKAKPATAKKG